MVTEGIESTEGEAGIPSGGSEPPGGLQVEGQLEPLGSARWVLGGPRRTEPVALLASGVSVEAEVVWEE